MKSNKLLIFSVVFLFLCTPASHLIGTFENSTRDDEEAAPEASRGMTDDWIDWTMLWNDSAASVASADFLNEKPAGQHGFDDGQFLHGQD